MEKVIILSTIGSEILPLLLPAMETEGIVVKAVVLDGIINEKNRKIVLERTKNFFDWPNFFDIERFNLPTYLVKNHNGENCLNLLKSLNPDLIINGGTPRILKSPILSLPKLGILNCHPGILPKYRGCTCAEWAIYNDDEVGATCHFMTGGIDAGPIVCSEAMTIRRGDSYEKMRTDLISHMIKVLVKGIAKVLQQRLSIDKLPEQTGEDYFKVISEEKLQLVRQKLIQQTYKCLR